MSLSVHSLASGSSGNSILVRDGRTVVLIDAGIGIRKLTAALIDARVNPADLSAILITHEHGDHTAGAVRMSRKFGIPLVANARTLGAMSGASQGPTVVLGVGEEKSLGSLCVRSFPISHDACHPVGYTVSTSRHTICSVTDTGVLTDRIRTEAAAADLLILESNHDVNMLEKGPYPWHLKRRILGVRGHLSNDTASHLLLEIAESGKKMAVWLAHLSKTNNTPDAAMACARKVLGGYFGSNLSVEVAKRDVPSLTWQPKRRAFQLSLFLSRTDGA